MKELDINTLIFNNTNILQELGVVVQEYPNIPKAQEEYETYDSKNGSIIYNKGTYKDITIQFSLALVYFKDNFWGRMDLVDEWLDNIVDNKLFYNRLDRYYKVKKVLKNDIKREAYYSEGEFQISFICSPFLVDVNKTELEITENNSTIYYFGTINSLPTLEIYGSGTIELNFNDNYLRIDNVQDKAIIKGELMEIVDSNGLNLKNYGNFPYLKKGENLINWVGNVEKINLTYETLYK
ncbi:distal tail protein Dit [Clostridium sp. Ade.TY]|uniref:distal tail protein Dit n=1 Tax=Clostridium sp. Ade.TY TaxID=1391647 RepID=UPI0004068C0C|nr:distal tail protein Dit [Clostridium sp. Ade.TY]